MQLHRPVRIDERQSGIVQQLTPLHLQPALPQRGPQAVEQQSDQQPAQHDHTLRLP